jgi:hypothetical protein
MAVKPDVGIFFYFLLVTNLAPGTTYIMEVVAYKKMYTSQPASITVNTDGKPLPKVKGLVCIEFTHACAHVLVHLIQLVHYVK